MAHKRVLNEEKTFKRQSRKSTVIPNGISTADLKWPEKSYVNSVTSIASMSNH